MFKRFGIFALQVILFFTLINNIYAAQALCSNGGSLNVRLINDNTIRVTATGFEQLQPNEIYSIELFDFSNAYVIARRESSFKDSSEVFEFKSVPTGKYSVIVKKVLNPGNPTSREICSVDNIQVKSPNDNLALSQSEPVNQEPINVNNPYTPPTKVVQGSKFCGYKDTNISLDTKILYDEHGRSKLIVNVYGIPLEELGGELVPESQYSNMFVELDGFNGNKSLCNGNRCNLNINPITEGANTLTGYVETSYVSNDDLFDYNINLVEDTSMWLDTTLCTIKKDEQEIVDTALYDDLCKNVRCASNEVCSIKNIGGTTRGVCEPLNKGMPYTPPSIPNDYVDPCAENNNICAPGKVCFRKSNTNYLCLDSNDVPNYNPLTNNGGNGSSSSTSPDYTIKQIITKLYFAILPIAVVIAIIKLLLALFVLATSQGDPGKLNEFKDTVYSVISGLVVIVGVVTLIKILSQVAGGI